jgi:hypothetical protein
MGSRINIRRSIGSKVWLVVLVGALHAPAFSQTPVDKTTAPPPDLFALAQQMPNCKEFRNACEVCVRLPGARLACSNVGIACSPSGNWRCSELSKTDEQAK